MESFVTQIWLYFPLVSGSGGQISLRPPIFNSQMTQILLLFYPFTFKSSQHESHESHESHGFFYLFTFLPFKFPRRSHPAKHGEGFDAPPTLERSGSEHRRAVTSFPLMVKGKAWLGIKDPPAGEGQEGQ